MQIIVELCQDKNHKRSRYDHLNKKKIQPLTRSGHSAFYLRKAPHGDPLRGRLVNLPSILCKKKKKNIRKKRKGGNFLSARVLKSSRARKVSRPPHTRIIRARKTDATINRLQTVCAPKKLSARPISKQCGLARAHGARGGRKRAAACEQQRLLLRLRLCRVCV